MLNLIVSLLIGGGLLTGVAWWHYVRGRQTWGQFFIALAASLRLRVIAGLWWLWHRLTGRLQGVAPAAPAPVPAAPPAAPPGPAPLPEPAEPALPSLDGAPIPPEWAALAGRIAAFEPENDAEFIQGIQGEAAGVLTYAEAWQEHAETLLTVIGMDPNATEAVAVLGEVLADTAADFGMVVRRFITVYAQVLQAVSDGVILPHNAREWLTGEVA